MTSNKLAPKPSGSLNLTKREASSLTIKYYSFKGENLISRLKLEIEEMASWNGGTSKVVVAVVKIPLNAPNIENN